MARKKEKPIRKTTSKGGNYRKTKDGAGMKMTFNDHSSSLSNPFTSERVG